MTNRLAVSSWNDARQSASTVRDAIANDSYDDLTAETEVDLPSEDTLREIVNNARTASDEINAVARALMESVDASSDEEPLNQWNDARRLATRVLGAVEDNEETYQAIASEYPHVEFPTEEQVAQTVADTMGSRTERINEIARWVMSWDKADQNIQLQYASDGEASDDTASNESDTVNADPQTPVEQAAADILQNFRNHEGRYGEIIREFSQLNLPPQPEMMMAARRVQNMDDTDAIAELSAEIEDWEATGPTSDGAPRSRYVYGGASQRP